MIEWCLQDTFCRCFLQEHETEVSQRRFTLQRGSSFFMQFYSFARAFFYDFSILATDDDTCHTAPAIAINAANRNSKQQKQSQ